MCVCVSAPDVDFNGYFSEPSFHGLSYSEEAFMGNSRKVFQCQEAEYSHLSLLEIFCMCLFIFGGAVLVALHRLSPSWGTWGLLFSVVHGLLSLWWLLSFQFAGSEQGLSSCGIQA